MTISLRYALRSDYPHISVIESKSFEFPWALNEFHEFMRNRNHIGAVAECNGSVVGYVFYGLYRDHLDLVNIAVDPDFRRIGIGHLMMKYLWAKLSPKNRRTISLTVSESNLSAHLFLRSQGFRAVRIIPQAFECSEQSGYLFEYSCVPANKNRISKFMEV